MTNSQLCSWNEASGFKLAVGGEVFSLGRTFVGGFACLNLWGHTNS